MPRLTTSDYLYRHDFLADLWSHADTQAIFTFLLSAEQRELHKYYQSHRELSREQLIAHRKEVSRTDPSLAHRAGKHFKAIEYQFVRVVGPMGAPLETAQDLVAALATLRLLDAQAQAMPVVQESVKKARKKPGEISIYPLATPELDSAELAAVFVAAADEIMRAKRQRTEHDELNKTVQEDLSLRISTENLSAP